MRTLYDTVGSAHAHHFPQGGRMKAKHLSVLLPIAMTGLSNAAWSAAVDNEDSNDTFANPDTWAWQSDNFNDASVDDDVDFFRLTGFVPGSVVSVSFVLNVNNGPVRMETFNTTQVNGNNIDLNSVAGSITALAQGGGGTVPFTIPSNGELGIKVSDLDTVSHSSEGYRITIEVLSVPSDPMSVPIAAWPVVPLLGAAGLAALRRKQKRPAEKQAA